MNGVEDEVGTMGGETRIYLLPSGALRSLDSQCNSSSLPRYSIHIGVSIIIMVYMVIYLNQMSSLHYDTWPPSIG